MRRLGDRRIHRAGDEVRAGLCKELVDFRQSRLGIGTEDLQQQVKGAMALIWRTIVMWLVVIARITLSGWGLG